jgi:hypothetical protein
MTTICDNDPDQLSLAGTYQDGGGNLIDDVCPSDCKGDINGDGTVNTADLLALLGGWGDPYTVADLLIVLGAWGPCP